jgi:hypothetical protein
VIHDISVTRRSTLKYAGAGAIAAVATKARGFETLAQDATPMTGGAAFATLGLPELNITITDTAYEGVESQLTAGMYLVHATYSGAEAGFLAFMQLPEGMTSMDLMSMMGGGEGGDMASPVAEGDEDMGGQPPEWFYTTYIPGGAGVESGQTAHFVIDLRPGNYIVWGEDPSAQQTPVDLTVTGDMASPAAVGIMPPAGVTISEIGTDNGYAFEFQGGLSEGSQVIAATNNSDQPHFVEFDVLPEGTTREDVDGLMQSFMTGTPAAGGLSESDIQPVYFIGTQSANTTQWHEVSLTAGTYLISCWIPDFERGGIPHAMEGMYDVITVGGSMASPTS